MCFFSHFFFQHFYPCVMAVPPSYGDLGKSAKDIFNKGYGKCLNWLVYPCRNDESDKHVCNRDLL
ncbi:unnamed protein product [Oncorhynchus mykiss]|uniref:Uncharacterized protein n=1 Tax=Oncorhynchus mykiss TaxID=8022 RepID=A0A060Z626_ONCMY|nr:unnamed protein product [Oncorhynchus mykiss]